MISCHYTVFSLWMFKKNIATGSNETCTPIGQDSQSKESENYTKDQNNFLASIHPKMFNPYS